MSGTVATGEIIERLVKQAGIRKKFAAEILHAIPEIIEEGLKKDGEVRVRGLGTFRMKWTLARIGRNPKTGVEVEIAPHYRLVFLPEQSLKDYINRDYRLLGYKVIPASDIQTVEEATTDEIFLVRDTVPEIIIAQEMLPNPVEEPEPASAVLPSVAEEIDYDYEPEPPEPKRKSYWMIPVAFAVIVVLGGVFYLRNCRQESRQLTVDSRQPEVDSSQVVIESSQLTVDSSRLAVDGRQEDDTINNSTLKINNSELNINLSTLSIKHSTLITSTKHLFQLSRDVYDGNPYLWVLIYKANTGVISDPENFPPGKEIIIPGLEGTPYKLSRADSAAVSEGYRLVYEFYLAKGDARAGDLLRASEKYKPK